MMNRIHSCPTHLVDSTADFYPDIATELLPDLEYAVLRRRDEPGRQQTTFVPVHYEPNYDYPLLVWLHGSGDDEHQLQRVMPHISLRNYLAVGPRGNCEPRRGELGFRWEQTESAILAAGDRVFAAIEEIQDRHRIAADRIFLAGYECGGTMALRLGLRHPDRFAGAISIGGPFPASAAPLARFQSLRQLPLLIGYGRESEYFPFSAIEADLRLFHAAALRVTLRQYPCGDELTTQMLLDLDAWMMEHISGAITACDAEASPFPANGAN